MNKRIKELAEQAGLKWKEQSPHFSNTDNPVDFPHSANADLEKFAELIITECLDQCYYRGTNDPLYFGQLKAAEYIEEYFGVE
jgi:hypothetical protein